MPVAPTMRDVAALAGVSVKTVSRVVNSEPHTRPEVVAKVRAAIEQLDWVPNGSARVLRTGRTGTIGIGVAELRRPYLATLVEVLAVEADRRGIGVAVEPHHGDAERVRSLLDSRGRVFDGVVHIGALAAGADTAGALTDRPLIVVQGGRALDGVDSVDDDGAQAAELIARHLAVMGRGRPVFLGFDGLPAAAVAALDTAGFSGSTVPTVGLPGTADRRAGADGVRRARELHPGLDALVCVNDEVALGALATLAQDGVGVPGDVAVIGYDNLDDGSFSEPTLTTVDPRPQRIARVALEMLAERLSGSAPSTARAVSLPVELLRRGSTLGGPP